VSSDIDVVADEQQHFRTSHQEVFGLLRGKEGCLTVSVEVELRRTGMNGFVLLPLDLFHPFGHSLMLRIYHGSKQGRCVALNGTVRKLVGELSTRSK
jgi:hypothetical protein